MRRKGKGGIEAILVLGLMCVVLQGCGGGGGGGGTGGGGGGGMPGLMGGSIQGTALSLVDNVTTFAGSLLGQSGTANGTKTNARFDLPIGITTDGTNLYVADSNNNTIRMVVISTGAVTTVAGAAGSVVLYLDANGTSARFNAPTGITTDGTNLYVADSGNNRIRKVVIGGSWTVTTIAGDGVDGPDDSPTDGRFARFSFPQGITMDGTNLYVADTQNNTIRKVVIGGAWGVTTIAGTAGSGTLYLDAPIGTNARFNFPQGITTDGTNLYVSDTLNHVIRKVVINPQWPVSTLAGSAGVSGSVDATGTAASFHFPYGITSDGTSLYVGDSFNNTIRKVVIATQVVTTVAGSASDLPDLVDGIGTNARFWFPDGITTDGKKLYVADSGNNTIRAIE